MFTRLVYAVQALDEVLILNQRWVVHPSIYFEMDRGI